MSVFLSDDMERAGKTLEDLLKAWPGYRVCSFTVDELRDCYGQEVVRMPIDEFPGHAEVIDTSGKRSSGTRSKMARGAYLHPAAQ